MSIPYGSVIHCHDHYRGILRLNALLQIDGSFEGEIISNNDIMISASAVVNSTISARSIVIGGAFKGEIHASERVTVVSGGVVNATIVAPRCQVEPGSIVNAHMTVVPQATNNKVTK